MESFHPAPFNWGCLPRICCARCPGCHMQMFRDKGDRKPQQMWGYFVSDCRAVSECLRVYSPALWVYFRRKIRWKYYVMAATFSDNHIYAASRVAPPVPVPFKRPRQWGVLYIKCMGSCFGQPSALFMPPSAYVHCLANKAKGNALRKLWGYFGEYFCS